MENAHFRSGKHNYGYFSCAAAYVFLVHHLNLDEDNIKFKAAILEDFVTILAQNQHRAYKYEYPLPEDALRGMNWL